MLSKALKTTGKTVLIAGGATLGLVRGLRILGCLTQNAAGLATLEARVDTLHLAVARLAEQAEHVQVTLQQTVTKDELSRTLDEVCGRLERSIDARFENQTRSVEALRMMVGQTDELLQKVLDGLKAISDKGDRDAEEREYDLSPTSH